MIKKIVKYCINKIKYGSKCDFCLTSKIQKESKFEGMNKLHHNVEFGGKLGLGSYISKDSSIFGNVGRFTSIGPYVRVNYGTHPYKAPFVSTHPSFYSLNPYKSQNGSTFAEEQLFEELRYADKKYKTPIIIGSDCWIGEGALLIGGITISDGAVILAHAVVTKDVPPFAIVGGIPATIKGYRYDDKTIEFILNNPWWNKNIIWMKQNWRLLTDMNEYKRNIMISQ